VSLYFLENSEQIYETIKVESLPGSTFSFKSLVGTYRNSCKETPRCPRLLAAFTLEAAAILPLLTYFFVSILFFFRVMQVQLEVQKALNDTGRELSVTLTGETRDSMAELLGANVLFQKKIAGGEEVKQYVSGGSIGISLLESQFSEQEILLRARYRMQLPINFFGMGDLWLTQKADCRKWNGWRGVGEAEGPGAWVYMTENGSVYHVSDACTHLKLSVRSADYRTINAERNENGGRYHPCSLCAGGGVTGGLLYITDQGDRYHTDISCGGIKRTILLVRLEEAGQRRKCSRCGG